LIVHIGRWLKLSCILIWARCTNWPADFSPHWYLLRKILRIYGQLWQTVRNNVQRVSRCWLPGTFWLIMIRFWWVSKKDEIFCCKNGKIGFLVWNANFLCSNFFWVRFLMVFLLFFFLCQKLWNSIIINQVSTCITIRICEKGSGFHLLSV